MLVHVEEVKAYTAAGAPFIRKSLPALCFNHLFYFKNYKVLLHKLHLLRIRLYSSWERKVLENEIAGESCTTVSYHIISNVI